MSFDRATGDLWVGDVGWELWELIYRVERGGNYGWSIMEGRQPVRPEGRRGPTPILPPTAEHPHSEAASITGGYVYRGDGSRSWPASTSTATTSPARSGASGTTAEGHLAGRAGRHGAAARLLRRGRAGELYLVEFERTNQIYRLVAQPAPARRVATSPGR